MDAEELARKMNEAAGVSLSQYRGLLPYAKALLQAEEALMDVIDSPAELDDARIDYMLLQVYRDSWLRAESALAAIRSLLEPKEAK